MERHPLLTLLVNGKLICCWCWMWLISRTPRCCTYILLCSPKCVTHKSIIKHIQPLCWNTHWRNWIRLILQTWRTLNLCTQSSYQGMDWGNATYEGGCPVGIVHSIRVGIWRSWCGSLHPWWGCFDIYLGIVEGNMMCCIIWCVVICLNITWMRGVVYLTS